MPMKHVKVLSKPVSADTTEQTAWVELKNLLNFFGPRRALTAVQQNWVSEQWYNYLAK